MSILSKRVAALEASLPPPPSQYVVADYCRGDDGFDAALAGILEKDRGRPGGNTDRDEVFSISVIKGLGQGEDLTIVRTVVDPLAVSELALLEAEKSRGQRRRPLQGP